VPRPRSAPAADPLVAVLATAAIRACAGGCAADRDRFDYRHGP